ncbi:hypothetical protein TAMC210_14600 [Thermanaeromonas sp. C210]|nr:hypothetical protein TAMC210_14600 [Thermanaeromonas sp. C210]
MEHPVGHGLPGKVYPQTFKLLLLAVEGQPRPIFLAHDVAKKRGRYRASGKYRGRHGRRDNRGGYFLFLAAAAGINVLSTVLSQFFYGHGSYRLSSVHALIIRRISPNSSRINHKVKIFLPDALYYKMVRAFTSGWALGWFRGRPSSSQRSSRRLMVMVEEVFPTGHMNLPFSSRR